MDEDRMVRKERLELSQVAPLEPKSSASTNFATFAAPLSSEPDKRGGIMPFMRLWQQIEKGIRLLWPLL